MYIIFNLSIARPLLEKELTCPCFILLFSYKKKMWGSNVLSTHNAMLQILVEGFA